MKYIKRIYQNDYFGMKIVKTKLNSQKIFGSLTNSQKIFGSLTSNGTEFNLKWNMATYTTP